MKTHIIHYFRICFLCVIPASGFCGLTLNLCIFHEIMLLFYPFYKLCFPDGKYTCRHRFFSLSPVYTHKKMHG